jgi:glycosyltransferase involved in cell wall biosynthesis
MITQAEDKHRLIWLKRTLSNLRQMTDYPYSLVVVDNGPKEQTDYLRTQDIDTLVINKVNMCMGYPRNQGANVSNGRWLAFIDNDIQFKKGWLGDCVELLRKYEDKKLIATPLHTLPMKNPGWKVGELDGHTLWKRAGSGCLVMSRITFEDIGQWANVSECGRNYCLRAVEKGYSYIRLKTLKAHHCCTKRTWKRSGKLEDGQWQ